MGNKLTPDLASMIKIGRFFSKGNFGHAIKKIGKIVKAEKYTFPPLLFYIVVRF